MPKLIKAQSGLLVVSGSTFDMRELVGRSVSTRPRRGPSISSANRQTIAGALIAALGGLDSLIDTAGIGENSAPVRAGICQGPGFLGVAIGESRNEAHETVILYGSGRSKSVMKTTKN